MSSAGTGAKSLHERAQGWPLVDRLHKLQGECGELIAAIDRVTEAMRNGWPTGDLLDAMATELEGVRITLENVKPETGELCRKVRAHQLQRFRNALERSGL